MTSEQGKNKGHKWKEGESGNPNGRPKKGYSITEMMKEMLNEQPEIKKGIGQRIAKKALEGDPAAIKMLWQYMDGMPLQKNETDVTSKGEKIEGFVVELKK